MVPGSPESIGTGCSARVPLAEGLGMTGRRGMRTLLSWNG